MESILPFVAVALLVITLVVWAASPSKKAHHDDRAQESASLESGLFVHDPIQRVARCLNKSAGAFFVLGLLLSGIGYIAGGALVAGMLGGGSVSLAVVCAILGGNLR